MQTLYDFGMEVQKIREAADSLMVKGYQNASLVVYIFNKCNDIIQAINDVIQTEPNPPSDQTEEDSNNQTEEEEGEMNGEQDSGTTS